jgi:hypothetical protein
MYMAQAPVTFLVTTIITQVDPDIKVVRLLIVDSLQEEHLVAEVTGVLAGAPNLRVVPTGRVTTPYQAKLMDQSTSMLYSVVQGAVQVTPARVVLEEEPLKLPLEVRSQ